VSLRASLITFALVPILAGCGGHGSATTSSAGPAWAVDSVPVTDIAGTMSNGDAAFLSVVSAAYLSNGEIVVADPYDAEIRYFDSAGQQVRAYGRAGKGPGELGRLTWIGRCGGDTVFAWDDQAHLTALDPTGRMVRQFTIPADSAGSPPIFVACAPNGPLAILMLLGGPGSPTSNMYQPGLLALSGRTGHVLRVVDSVSIGQGRVFPRVTQLALSTDRLFVGPEDSARVLVYALDGAPRGGLAIGVDGRPVSDREYDRAIEQQAAVFSDESMRKQSIAFMHRVPKPKTLAPYFALFAVGHDTLWAQVSAPGDSVTVLDAVGPDGKPAGEARIPRDLRVLDMGRDYVLGEYDAPDGEQHVALYRMHPPATR